MSAGDWKDLYAAARAGDLELVRFHVDQGVDVNHVHPEYQGTVLVAAILAGHEDVAHILLDSGADPAALSELDDLIPAQAARQMRMTGVETRLGAIRRD
ncbi:ankyrin repeat domain-containing protein [Aeromicrobium sp.]|uniref:ankyrin repeat domain-containing protein n=1 Tax=Aeromicrobium sp. TaxID=1871063 RepID=UPI002FCADCD6